MNLYETRHALSRIARRWDSPAGSVAASNCSGGLTVSQSQALAQGVLAAASTAVAVTVAAATAAAVLAGGVAPGASPTALIDQVRAGRRSRGPAVARGKADRRGCGARGLRWATGARARLPNATGVGQPA